MDQSIDTNPLRDIGFLSVRLLRELPESYVDGSLQVCDEKLLYIKIDRDGARFLVHGEEEYGPYSGISNVCIVDQELLYVARVDQDYFVFYKKMKHGPYRTISDVRVVDGKLLYAASTDYMKWFLFFGAWSQPTEHTSVHDLQLFEDKLLFHGERSDRREVVFDGTVLWSCRAHQNHVMDLKMSQSGVTFQHENPVPGERECVVWFGDKKIVHKMLQVEDLQLADDHPIFSARINGRFGSDDWFVYVRGERRGPYERVSGLSFLDGKVFYGAERNGQQFFYFGGWERKIPAVVRTAKVNDEKLYICMRQNDLDWILCDDREFPMCDQMLGYRFENGVLVTDVRIAQKVYEMRYVV